MKIFDFNVHLPQKVSDDVNEVIADDLSLDAIGLVNGLNVHSAELRGVSGINVMLFNQQLFGGQGISQFTNAINKHFDSFALTALIDFRRPDRFEYLESANAAGVDAYMFNSYLQKISESDFEKVLEVCRYGEEHSKVICIDASYGTSKMYTYDNMKLACYVADHISKVPIVIIHSGGYRIIDAMWLALDKKNVALDTSFSLNCYLGSSLEQDYAFAYRKLGATRVLAGTDVPYMPFQKTLTQQIDFFTRNRFSDSEIEAIFYRNAIELLNGRS